MSEKLFLRHKITMPIQALASKQDTMEVMRKYVEVMWAILFFLRKKNRKLSKKEKPKTFFFVFFELKKANL